MIDTILTWLQGFPPELIAGFLASLPVVETRVALPVAIFALHLSPLTAFLSTFLGNVLPVPFIFAFLTPCLNVIHRRLPHLGQRFLRWQEVQEKKY